MSLSILSGDFTVYLKAENRQKRIVWSGSATGTRSVNELYSALQDEFDELNQMDDGTPMSAQTNFDYTIGIIDAGDADPWFIDRTTVEHLTGGAITTASWTRATGTNTGIIKVVCNNTNIVAGDIGLDISGATTGNGTLLDVKGTGADSELWIRPDTSGAGDDFTTDTQVITCNAHTAAQTGALSYTGESLWSNIYSIGTIEANTRMYAYQDDALLTKFKDTVQWWFDGHIDILVNVKEIDVETDEGYISVFARQFSKSYSYYIVDVSAGGRNPLPLQTGNDLNVTEGTGQFITNAASGTWDQGDVGAVMQEQGNTDCKAVITSLSGTSPNFTIQYYLIGKLEEFDASDVLEDEAQTKTITLTASAPTDVNAAALSGLSIVHANTVADVDQDGTDEYYSIAIDVSLETVEDAYPWAQWICQRGEIGTGNTDGQEGEQYIGTDYRILYTTLSGSIAEGSTVIQDNTLAEGVVVAHHTTPKILILRNSRGAFNNTDTIRETGNNVTGVTCTPITPIAAAPFGLFAGGIWFLAPGAYLLNRVAADSDNYSVTDDEGNVVEEPTSVTVTIGNTLTLDRVAMFRIVSSVIKKDEYTIDAAQPAPGGTTIKVDPNISAEAPGKTSGGVLFVVDITGQIEHRYRYLSWATDVFTLFNITGLTADGSGCTSTHIQDTGALFQTNGVQVGDILRNTTESVVAYVTEVVDESNLNTTPVTDWTGDSYEIGTVVETYTTSDTVYVAFIHEHRTAGGSAQESVIYTVPINVRVVARQAGDIIPFSQDGQITAAGLTINVIRNADNIYT